MFVVKAENIRSSAMTFTLGIHWIAPYSMEICHGFIPPSPNGIMHSQKNSLALGVGHNISKELLQKTGRPTMYLKKKYIEIHFSGLNAFIPSLWSQNFEFIIRDHTPPSILNPSSLLIGRLLFNTSFLSCHHKHSIKPP